MIIVEKRGIALQNDQTAQRSSALGTEHIFKLILQYAIPAIAMMLISSLYNIVDKVFVGNFVGQIGITATTVVNPAVRIIDAFAMLVGAGGSTLLALRLGEGKSEEAESILNNSFLLTFLISVVLMVLGYGFSEPMLRLFGAGDEVMPYALTYLKVVLIGAFFNSTANGFGMFVRVDGSPKRMMVCSITGCVLNIILDPIAIYVLGWGIAGAAAATAFSQVVSGLMVIHYFTLSRRSTMKLRLSKMRLGKEHTKKTAELGFSSFLQQFTGSISQSVLLSCLAIFATAETVSGDVAQASVGITVSIGLFFLLPAIGISSAIQPIIGYNYGAKNYHRVVDTLRTATVFAIAMLTVGWIIILIFAEPLCRIFGATGSDLQHAAYTMRVYNLLLPLVPFGNVGSGFFQSIGQPKKAIFISLSRQILCLIPMVLILGSIFGQNGVLYSLPVADLVSSAVALILMVSQCKKLRQEAA
jgi:putative MATE family efflux protein